MVKEFIYKGTGVIEFGLIASNRRYTLREGDSVVAEVTKDDLRVLPALARLGVIAKDFNPVPIEEVEEPKVEVVEEVHEEEEPAKPSIEELLKKTRAQLCQLADSLGVVYPEKATKREIATLIVS